MQIKRILKVFGIIFGCIALFIVGTLIVIATKSGQSQKRAENFCSKVEVNADLSSLENILATDSPDLIHVLSNEGAPIGAFDDYRKLKLGNLNKSAAGFLMIFKSSMPAFSGCEVQFQDKKILSKKIVRHD